MVSGSESTGGVSIDIEAFATAVAHLSHPFADRVRILAELDLDEQQWRALASTVAAMLRDEAERGASAQFTVYRKAFARTKRELAARARPAVAETERDSPLVSARVDETAIALPVLRPALPFSHEGARRLERAPNEAKSSYEPSSSGADATVVMELPCEQGAPLPFVPHAGRRRKEP
jgi:hypothetical protein